MNKIEDLLEIKKVVKANVEKIIKESTKSITLEEYVNNINTSGTGKALQNCVNAFPEGFERITAYDYLVFYYDNFIKKDSLKIELDDERLEKIVAISYLAYMKSQVDLDKEDLIKLITIVLCKALEIE